MCGLAGIVSQDGYEGLSADLAEMMLVQQHRGPDACDSWTGRIGNCTLGLGHLRLAIIDLTESGKQPMILPDRSGIIIFNGEIYNYKELRVELEREGVTFRTESDTEVLAWALRTWGEMALQKLNGMWAFAWLDLRNSKLMLARDRFGIKPLYLYRDGSRLLFASEIKGILAAARRRFSLNLSVIGRFVSQSLLDSQPESFFDGIVSLEAGCFSVTDLNEKNVRPVTARYWYPPVKDNFEMPLDARIERVRDCFLDAARLRLRSDVPVGVLLSGGLDSSSIVSAMRSILGNSANLHILSATSDDAKFNERPYIETVAQHVNSPVHFINLRAKPDEWFSLLRSVIHTNDEPVGNFSTVAHYLLMERARELGITVILSGQGADEILCGYRKFLGFRLQELLNAGHVLKAVQTLGEFVRNRTIVNQFEWGEAKRYLKLPAVIGRTDVRGPCLARVDSRVDTGLSGASLVERQARDLSQLSVPALLHYEDRCSMASAREIRLPFLDYRLVSMLLGMDPDFKLRDGWTKWIFRKAMEPFLPQSIAWRRDKQAFINPQSTWLQNELRPTITNLIGGDMAVYDAGLIDPKRLRARYQAYCSQRSSASISFKDVFNPIALELWAREFESNLDLRYAI